MCTRTYPYRGAGEGINEYACRTGHVWNRSQLYAISKFRKFTSSMLLKESAFKRVKWLVTKSIAFWAGTRQHGARYSPSELSEDISSCHCVGFISSICSSVTLKSPRNGLSVLQASSALFAIDHSRCSTRCTNDRKSSGPRRSGWSLCSNGLASPTWSQARPVRGGECFPS